MAIAIAIFVAVTSLSSAKTYEISTECPNSLNEITLLAHEHDCTKYYKCFNGQKQSMDCPPYIPGHRKHFDAESKSCVPPWKSKCVSQTFDCFTDGYVEPHPYNCNLYYVCTNGEKVENSCKGGELFDSKTMKCVAKEKATCNLYVCPNGKFDPVFLPHECKCQSLYYECVDGEFVERYCQKGEDFDVESRRCVLSHKVGCNATTINDCPVIGIAYIADKTDCSSYYVCKNGVKSKKICDFGLSYNEESSMCTWPPSSMCSSKSLKPTKKAATPNAIEQVETNRKCPPKGSEEKAAKFPHECSCTVYYECKDGQLFRETCPNGLIYDHTREVCDYPHRAKCKNQKFNYDFTLANSECPPTGNARIPHETNCSSYYECNNGHKRLESCLQGHYFNDLIESCDLPWNVNCKNSPNSNSSIPQEPSECKECGCNNCITRFPDLHNCSLYYQCENDKKVLKECPEGLHYDSVNQICNFPKNVNCEKCKKGEKRPHECQCNEYYECVNGYEVLRVCPQGQYFDRNRKICKEGKCPDKVDQVGCIGTCSSFYSTEYLLHKDCDKYCVCENGHPYIVKCPKKKVYDPKNQRCEWPENVANLTCDPFPCDSNSEGDNLPHKCHCDKYFVCRNGLKYRENCEEGKYFDYEKEICVDINQAHCYHGKKLKSEP